MAVTSYGRTVGAVRSANNIVCAQERSEASGYSTPSFRVDWNCSYFLIARNHKRISVSCRTNPQLAPLVRHPKKANVVVRSSTRGTDNNDEQLAHIESSKASEDEQILARGLRAPKPDTETSLPSFQDGITWFCISLITLIGLIDISPLPSILQSLPPSYLPPVLAATQFLFFLIPSLSWANDCKFNLPVTFRISPPNSIAIILAAVIGGASLWLLLVGAISLKEGLPLDWQWPGSLLLSDVGGASDLMSRATGAVDSLTSAAAGATSLGNQVLLDPVMLPAGTDTSVLTGLLTGGEKGASVLLTGVPASLLWVAVVPAVNEELLFRGLLLTAVMQRLGRIDAVMLTAALFSLFHLSPSLFFPNTVLGIAAGLVTLSSDSILPAVVLHASYNAAAVLYAASVAAGLIPSGVVVPWLLVAALVGGAASLRYCLPPDVASEEHT